MLTLQVGGLVNAFGNGMVIPFMFIYLHNLRGIGPDSRAAVTRATDAEPAAASA